jgi:YbbR domain-containing protein
LKQTSPFGISENTSYKIVALLITLILWVIILGSREQAVSKFIPTEYLLPRDTMIVNTVPHEVAFKVVGQRLGLKKFTEMNEPLTIDLTSAVEGITTVRIHPDSINVPQGLRVVNVSPNVITPNIEKLVSKFVRIEILTTGSLPDGLTIKSAEVEPKEWSVTGARTAIERLQSIKTAPIELSKIKESLTEDVPLIIIGSGLLKQQDAKVRINLVVK